MSDRKSLKCHLCGEPTELLVRGRPVCLKCDEEAEEKVPSEPANHRREQMAVEGELLEAYMQSVTAYALATEQLQKLSDHDFMAARAGVERLRLECEFRRLKLREHAEQHGKQPRVR